MAQIGTAAVVEGNSGIAQPTAAKTSTAGSLVVFGGATWHATVAQTPTFASSLAGTYTAHGNKTMNVGAERVMYGLASNIGGTRGASHTATIGPVAIARSGSFEEFDSVTASPTITVGTEATNAGSTAPSCQVTVPSGTATVVAIMVYGGAATTAIVADGTQIAEADENSDWQDHFVAAKFGVSGTVTITWTLAASRQWACYAVAFQETGGGARGLFRTSPMNGVGIGGSFFRDALSAPYTMRNRIYVPARMTA